MINKNTLTKTNFNNKKKESKNKEKINTAMQLRNFKTQNNMLEN